MDHGCSPTKICKSFAGEDLISNLPDALKDKILCCLPIKEAVGTCLLSRNWRYTWTSMTELMFRGDDYASKNGNVIADDDVCRFLKFTDMFLSLHNGPILKFGLDTKGIEISTGGHIYRWMLILSRNRIRELQLRISMHDCYKIPSCFFSCDELEYVHLRNITLTTSQFPMLSKGFKQLHTLHLELFILEGNNFGDLVASCPNLEKLTLLWFLSHVKINIHSTKLKILSVHGQFNHLSLHTPYLTSAVIDLKQVTPDASRARCNFNFSQFIASLSNIEKVSLHGPIFEVKISDRPIFLVACYFTVRYYVYGPLASLQRAEHEFFGLKPPKSFNQLTEISMYVDLGNVNQANLALCLFQHAPNLQVINLKVN
jgi:hypothetical protein